MTNMRQGSWALAQAHDNSYDTSPNISHETSQGTSPEKNTDEPSLEKKPAENDSKNQIIMHPYRFVDGKVMYYPPRLVDIEEKESGKISVSNLIRKSGYKADETNPNECLFASC